VDEPAVNVEGNSETGVDEAYERAKKHALTIMRPGFHMGGGPYPTRDELHERRPDSSGPVTSNVFDEDSE
jgi:hypothetical protein